MIRFRQSLDAWGRPNFESVLKAEVEALDPDLLPLQAALSRTSFAIGEGFRTRLLAISGGNGTLRVKMGIFYAGIIAGCSCADDPTPIDDIDEYCEVEFAIDRRTGEATVTLIDA